MSTLELDPGEMDVGWESPGGKESARVEVLEVQDTLRGSLDLHLQTWGSMSSLSLGKLRESSVDDWKG